MISHADLVSVHEDVILGCIDDPDISIRMQALDLSARMVNQSNLVAVIQRLMLQLKNAPNIVPGNDTDRARVFQVEPAADSDGEDPEAALRPLNGGVDSTTPLSAEYRVAIIRKILEMCSKDNYANITDFQWYIDTLLQLVKLTPATVRSSLGHQLSYQHQISDAPIDKEEDVAYAIGSQLLNVAVRVKTVRAEAVHAANVLVTADLTKSATNVLGLGFNGALGFAVWIVGEFATSLHKAHETLDSLLHPNVRMLPPPIINAYLQSIPKVLASTISRDLSWDSERRSMVSFLLARIVSFLEPLAAHPSLEVQERAVELAELIRVAIQAIQSPENHNNDEPLLLTRAIPSLFTGTNLNPIAPAAQRNVPLPDDLNLDTSLHPYLQDLLQAADLEPHEESDIVEFEHFYRNRPRKLEAGSASDRLSVADEIISSYQKVEEKLFDRETKRIDRRARNKDDPFYIASDDFSSGTSTPIHEILRSSGGDDVDIDTIPIMDLDLGAGAATPDFETQMRHRKIPRIFDIATDENIENSDSATDSFQVNNRNGTVTTGQSVSKGGRGKKSLLEVDSSGLGSFSISEVKYTRGGSEIENHEADDADMVKALEEVERLRLEMQRASERTIIPEEIPPEGTLVKKRKKKRDTRKRTKEPGLTMPETLPLNKETELDINSQDNVSNSTLKVKKKKKNPVTRLVKD